MNALVTVLLVILKGEKAHFDQQKEMMHFHSLQDSHCSSAADEERIRQAIAGSEDEVETVISILLAAGAYTDNLRRAWDNGLDVERAGMTDVKSGVFFSILIWSVCARSLVRLLYWSCDSSRTLCPAMHPVCSHSLGHPLLGMEVGEARPRLGGLCFESLGILGHVFLAAAHYAVLSTRI